MELVLIARACLLRQAALARSHLSRRHLPICKSSWIRMREGERVVVFHPEFLEDLPHWVQCERRTAKRLLDLKRAISKDTFGGIGKPKPLK
jgi:hypothetical protein